MDPTADGVAAYASGALSSARLRLRPVEQEELALLERWWNMPESILLQTEALLPRPAGARLEQFGQWHANESSAAVGFGIERRGDAEFLGSTVLFGATMQTQTATFAIQLRPEVTGQGLGLEATRLMIDYGFSVLPLHRIELQVHSFNDRARRCYRRAGFVQEGVRRAVTFADGEWHDQILMGMLREDWSATRRR